MLISRRGLLSFLALTPLARFLPAPKPVPDVLTDKSLGISIRFIKQWDVTSDKWPTRLDAKWEEAVLDPRWETHQSVVRMAKDHDAT